MQKYRSTHEYQDTNKYTLSRHNISTAINFNNKINK